MRSYEKIILDHKFARMTSFAIYCIYSVALINYGIIQLMKHVPSLIKVDHLTPNIPINEIRPSRLKIIIPSQKVLLDNLQHDEHNLCVMREYLTKEHLSYMNTSKHFNIISQLKELNDTRLSKNLYLKNNIKQLKNINDHSFLKDLNQNLYRNTIFKNSQSLSEKETIDYYELIIKGSFRLGKSRSFMSIIIMYFLTFGLYIKPWYDRLTLECLTHLDDPLSIISKKKSWTIIIPGYHIRKLYSLSKTILQMEVRNKYTTTSPFYCLLLSFFPLLSMLYLQRSANQHWRLHTTHFISRYKM